MKTAIIGSRAVQVQSGCWTSGFEINCVIPSISLDFFFCTGIKSSVFSVSSLHHDLQMDNCKSLEKCDKIQGGKASWTSFPSEELELGKSQAVEFEIKRN